MSKTRLCCVLRPDGSKDAVIAERNAKVLERLIDPSVTPFGYVVIASDQLRPSRPLFDDEMVAAVLDTELVVVDLAGMDSGVLYIMARLHGDSRPCIVISSSGDAPDEIAQQKVFKLDLDDQNSLAEVGRAFVERLLLLDVQNGIRAAPGRNGSQRLLGDESRYYPPRLSEQLAKSRVTGNSRWKNGGC